MLSELEIHHLGPIEKATIKPGTGMTVITGETGAGKSMLLSAINMITGDKVASTSITPGASNATAIGVFDYENETDTISTTASISNNANTASTNNTNPSTTAKSDKTNTTNTTNSNPVSTANTVNNASTDASNDDAIITSNASTIADTDNVNTIAGTDNKNKPEALVKAENAGIEIDNDEPELIMKRVIPVKGRGKCIINGETVVRSTMSNIGDSLITIHGQSDQLRISSPARQLTMLDTYADDNAELNAYTTAFNARMKTESKLNTINDPETIDRADYLQNAIKRIKKADLHNGEYDKLKQQVKDMETSADRRNALMRALNALNGDGNDSDDGNNAVSALNTVIDCLDDADTDTGSNNQVNEWVVSLNSMIESLDDMSNAIMSAIDGIESFDINAANQRLLEINHVIKRYGGSEAKALETLNKYEKELDTLIIDPDEVAGLESELKKLKKVEDKAAAALTLKRKKAALELSKNVNNELHGLAMPNARMIINVDSKVPDSSGHDSVVFMLSAYKGAPLLPISKSASGGELSRIMLALELSLAVRHPDNNLTFVFDEVDANLGGTTGMEIGRRLARLAESSQVIIVSHLAQVAAYAGTQYVVSKNENTDNDSRTITSIHEVNGDDRIREIARMLSGEVSEISCEHARQLLDKCRHYDDNQ